MSEAAKIDPDQLVEKAIRVAKAEALDRCRNHLLAFACITKPDFEPNWHHRILCKYLDRFARGEIKRLMVTMPPRHGKSELVSRRLPAFVLGRDPDDSVIATSYSADLASRMNRDVQRVIDDPIYQEIFPKTKLFSSNVRSVAKGTWLRNNDIFEIVNHRGVYRSAGVGGGITGMGAKTLIIDDPIKNQEEALSKNQRDKLWEWYASTLYTRLEKDGRILVTLTRWHEDDLGGKLLKNMAADDQADQWTIVDFPAIKENNDNPEDPRKIGESLWPNKYPVETLNKIRSSVGSRVWEALYQQRPTADTGNIIKRHWFKFYKRKDLPKLDEASQFWDLTFKEGVSTDYVVGAVFGRAGANKYLLDLVRDRLDFPKTIQAFLNLTAKWPQAKLKVIEDKANGPALIASLKSKVTGIVPFDPKTSKEARLHAVSPDIEAGNVWLPDPSEAPWVHGFIEEVCAFPNGAHDDQVDVLTMALMRLSGSGRQTLEKLLDF